MKQFTDIPINRGPFKEKTKTGWNFTVTGISAICHLLINASESLVFPNSSDRNQWYFNLQKDFQRLKLIFLFLPLAVFHVGHTIYPKTPIDNSRCPFTPQDALYMVRKSFILFYMINWHKVITFLLCITVFHRRAYKFHNSYWTYLVNSTSPCH